MRLVSWSYEDSCFTTYGLLSIMSLLANAFFNIIYLIHFSAFTNALNLLNLLVGAKDNTLLNTWFSCADRTLLLKLKIPCEIFSFFFHFPFWFLIMFMFSSPFLPLCLSELITLVTALICSCSLLGQSCWNVSWP